MLAVVPWSGCSDDPAPARYVRLGAEQPVVRHAFARVLELDPVPAVCDVTSAAACVMHTTIEDEDVELPSHCLSCDGLIGGDVSVPVRSVEIRLPRDTCAHIEGGFVCAEYMYHEPVPSLGQQWQMLLFDDRRNSGFTIGAAREIGPGVGLARALDDLLAFMEEAR